jgi:hypothetical protein
MSIQHFLINHLSRWNADTFERRAQAHLTRSKCGRRGVPLSRHSWWDLLD